MKRILTLFLILAVIGGAAGCTPSARQETEKLTVVTTNFPPYDFTRQIAGERAEVTMLLKPGMESHAYEPTPQDLAAIQNADIFIYGGGESDQWTARILTSLDLSKTQVIAMMDAADTLQEEHAEHEQHDHEEAVYDEHVWTSPRNAVKIVRAISAALCAADPAHAADYSRNTESYVALLEELDSTFREIVSQGVRRTIVFGDRFPFLYLTAAYGLEYAAAFPGCTAETEPSAKTLAELTDKIKSEGIPVVFYVEQSNQKIADTLCEATGAKKLLLHSCHNVTADELAQGVTYLQLMETNAGHLREALS